MITGYLSIVYLDMLNNHPDVFNFVEPVFLPILNSGSITTLGDKAQGAFDGRAGFQLTGAGVKVGVMSDSYNMRPNNPANLIDVPNGDLPGPGNPEGNLTPVQVLQELTVGKGTDEGRAMLQIIHDIVPGAALAFLSLIHISEPTRPY